MKIGSVTSKFKNGVCEVFATTRQKMGKNWQIILNTLATARLMFTVLPALVAVYVGIIKLALILRSLKGRCYGNQLI